MSDKDFFEQDPLLQSIVNPQKEIITYEQMMAKPLLTGNDILNFPSEPNNYLVENFLWKNSISIVLGQEKACKSILTVQKAMAMTCGKPFLGCYDVIRPLKVLYLQAESDLGETKERFINATQKGGVIWTPENWRHFAPAAMAIDIDGEQLEDGTYPEGTYNDIMQRIERDGFKPDVITIDPLYMAMDGDLNDNKAARHFCRNVRKMKDRLDCAVIIVHHEHRPRFDRNNQKLKEGDDSIFGSSMFKNFASHVFRISITNDKGKEVNKEREEGARKKYRKISCHTSRNDNAPDPIVLELQGDPLMLHIVGATEPTHSSKEIVETYIRTKGEASAPDIHEDTGISDSAVRKAISKLREEGRIEVSSKSSRKVYYKTTTLEK
jgi:RecA-family ATPase